MLVSTPILNLVMILCFLLCNYPYNVFVNSVPFHVSNVCLYKWFLTGPEGDLRVYLEQLAEAQNVQEYVAHHPFDQRVITESDPSWSFYSRIASADSW